MVGISFVEEESIVCVTMRNLLHRYGKESCILLSNVIDNGRSVTNDSYEHYDHYSL